MTALKSLDRLSALIEAAAAVVEETDLEDVLRRLVSEARAATGARYAALGVLGEHGVLSDFLYEGVSVETARKIGHLPTGRGVLGTVIRENTTLRLSSIRDHPDSFGFPEHHPPMETFLGVPVAVSGEAFGNLYLTDKEGEFTDEDVLVAEALSRIAGAAVQTARLHGRLRRLAVVEDRERIARDLHDSVIQDIFAVGLGLQGLASRVEDPETMDLLGDAIERLDDAVGSLRGYIFELKKPAGADQRLDDRLQELVSRMGSAYPAKVTLDLSLRHDREYVLAEEIVKIVTEGLSNALRHSAAGSIEVSVAADDSRYLIRVVDDGTGFDPDRAAWGMGLLNMRARTQRLGGSISIQSRPGRGTTVEVTFPLAGPGDS